MLASDVRNEFLDDDRLADARAAVEANLTAANERGDEVDDLDAGFEHGWSSLLLRERRRIPVDAPHRPVRNGGQIVDRQAEYVEHAAERLLADGHLDCIAGINRDRETAKAVGAVHRKATHPVITEMLLHFGDEWGAILTDDVDRVVDGRKAIGRELDIEYRPDDLDDASVGCFCHDHWRTSGEFIAVSRTP